MSKQVSLVGEPANPFQLHDTSGVVHSLKEDEGHWLLLILHRHLG